MRIAYRRNPIWRCIMSDGRQSGVRGGSCLLLRSPRSGKRTGVIEKTLVDTVLQETRIDWLYDNLGRLTGEAYDGYEITGQASQDYIARYKYDLVGNRLEKAVLRPSSANDLSGDFASLREIILKSQVQEDANRGNKMQ